VAVRVTDGYDGSDGQLDVRLLMLPLQRRRGPELARAEALRYLAEVAWVPHAILRNPQLEWRELDQRAVEVATSVRSDRIAVRLVFNEEGEITQAIAERPRMEAGNAIMRWVGEYTAYQELGGVVVPWNPAGAAPPSTTCRHVPRSRRRAGPTWANCLPRIDPSN